MSDTEQAPRRFVIPACPEDVTRVRPVAASHSDLTFVRTSDEDGFADEWKGELGGARITWKELLEDFPSGLVEVPETELDAAKRRLRAAGYPDNIEAAGGFYNTMGKDVTRVMRHVLAEEAA